MTFDLYSDWFKAAGCVDAPALIINPLVRVSCMFIQHEHFLCREKDLPEKLQHFRILLQKLPAENYNNLRWGFTFFAPHSQLCPLS